MPIPTTPGAFQETFGSGSQGQGYVSKMDSTGSSLLWSTYLGGDEGSEQVDGLAVDAAHAVYVTGLVTSDDFPVTPGAFFSSLWGPNDGFVTKLLPDGSDLVWSTYIGGCGGGGGYTLDLAIDAAGNAHVAGYSNEPGWPTTPADAFQPAYIGPFPEADATLSKVNAFGEMLVYSTWFGGTGTDFP